MTKYSPDKIRELIRDYYGNVAKGNTCGCSENSANGCCPPRGRFSESTGKVLGYSEADLSEIVEGANMNLGCGNPVAISNLQLGETVLDLGCGGGFDSFLAAKSIGPEGHVIGVDMTPEMINKARHNAKKIGVKNVEFRLGEIENIPVADNSVDIIMSNCVINLSPDKNKVFQEAFRVLKIGGRLAISDIVAIAPLPEAISNNPELIASCIGGAATIKETEKMLKEAGFDKIRIESKKESHKLIEQWAPSKRVEDYVVSAYIEAKKH